MVRDPARYWFLIVLAYYGLHAVLRAVLGQPLTEAEARMTELGWQLSWAYDAMLPLYPWLQNLAFELFGPGVLAIAALKNAVMAALAALVFLIVRGSAGRGWAWLALLSLMLLPQVAWHSHHALGDDFLASAFAAASVLALIRLRRRAGAGAYLMLGLCLGLGALSALSFHWFALALIGAGLTLPAFRKPLLQGRVLFALVPCAAIVAMPVMMSGSLAPLVMGTPAGGAAAAAQYLLTLMSTAALLMAVVAVSLVTGHDRLAPVAAPVGELRQLLGRITAIGIVFVLAATFGGLAHGADAGDVLPVVLCLAPATALFLCPMISARGRLRITRFAGAVALCVLAASPVYHSWTTGGGYTAEAETLEETGEDGAS